MKWKWLGLCGVVLLGVSVQAGRPLVTDDAEPVAYREFELEAGVAYSADSDVEHIDVPITLGYGLLPRLEVSAGFGGTVEAAGGCLGDR